MKFNIELTWSKLVAVLILGSAVYLDTALKTEGKLFMFALPFVAGLIGLKQGTDLIAKVKK